LQAALEKEAFHTLGSIMKGEHKKVINKFLNSSYARIINIIISLIRFESIIRFFKDRSEKYQS